MKSLFIAFIAVTLSVVVCIPVNGQRQSSDARLSKYIDGVLKTYDEDGDESLSRDEVAKMRRPPVGADVDNNGLVSRTELYFNLFGKVPDSAIAGEHHQVYAEHMMRLYDTDKDGKISKDENRKASPRIESRFDLNRDGKFSLDEITKMVSRPSAAKVSNKSDSVKSATNEKFQELAATQSFMIAAGARTFAESVLEKNDRDKNNELSASEISDIEWMSPSWKASDRNKDNVLTESELIMRYRGIFDYQAKRLDAIDTAMAHGAKILIAKNGPNEKGPDQAVAKTYEGTAVGNDNAQVSPTSKDSVINVDLYLIRMPQNTNASFVASAMSKMRESSLDSLPETLSAFQKSAGNAKLEMVGLATIHNGSVSMSSGSEESQTVGYSSRGGVRTESIQKVDVGFLAKVNASKSNGNFVIDLELKKSDILDKERDQDDEGNTPLPIGKVIEWSFESTMLVESGKPTVVASSSKGQNWILVVSAY